MLLIIVFVAEVRFQINQNTNDKLYDFCRLGVTGRKALVWAAFTVDRWEWN